jgi:hypothetical protein
VNLVSDYSLELNTVEFTQVNLAPVFADLLIVPAALKAARKGN